MKRFFLAAFVALGLMMPLGGARAALLTYTESATVSGSLNGVGYTNQVITISTTADTAAISGGSGFFQIIPGTVNFTLSGGASGTFTGIIRVFVNPPFPAAGFGDTATGSILDTIDSAFAAYDLSTPFGPITNTPFIRPDLSFGTTAGALIISESGPATFEAATVPEPATLALLGVGLAGLGLVRRRRG